MRIGTGRKMIRHIILWKLKDGIDKEYRLNRIKSALESLNGKIDGMIKAEVRIEKLKSSNADAMLDSLFETEEALRSYAKNPLHNEIADSEIRPYYVQRMCIDIEEK